LVSTAALAIPFPVFAQKFEDIDPPPPPGSGYTPDPKKVFYVIFWHHKKLVVPLHHKVYDMNKDGVNFTTARKMAALMEERFPNLVVYVKETNERDVNKKIESEEKRIKNIQTEWVDVEQPSPIELPKKRVVNGTVEVYYDESAELDPKLLVGMWRPEAKKSVGMPGDNSMQLFANGNVTRYTSYVDKVKGTWSVKGNKIEIKTDGGWTGRHHWEFIGTWDKYRITGRGRLSRQNDKSWYDWSYIKE
jgi:hypothetical protein